jgi:hypothetical protein
MVTLVVTFCHFHTPWTLSSNVCCAGHFDQPGHHKVPFIIWHLSYCTHSVQILLYEACVQRPEASEPTNLLSNGYQGVLSRGKARLGCDTAHPHLVLRPRMSRSCTLFLSLSHNGSRGTELLYILNVVNVVDNIVTYWGVLFKMDFYCNLETRQTTVKWN